MGEAAPGIGFRLVQLAVLLFTIFCSCLEAQESGAASIQPLLKTGDSAIAQGDYDAALRSFEKAQQIAQQMAADSPIRYGVLKRLTSASAASGQFTNAQQYLQQAIAWRESIPGPKDPKIADDLLLLVNLYMRTKAFDQALATAQRVEAMHGEAYTSESIRVGDDLVRIGEIYLAENKPREAVHSLGATYRWGTVKDGGETPWKAARSVTSMRHF